MTRKMRIKAAADSRVKELTADNKALTQQNSKLKQQNEDFEGMPGIKSRCEALEMDNTWLRDNIHLLNTQITPRGQENIDSEISLRDTREIRSVSNRMTLMQRCDHMTQT